MTIKQFNKAFVNINSTTEKKQMMVITGSCSTEE